MRKEAVRALRAEFRRSIETTGQFRLTKEHGAPGSDIYVASLAPNIYGFVELVPNPKSYTDSFMIELAWGSKPEFPTRAPLQHKRQLNVGVDGRIRLPNLWREDWASALEPWWELGPGLLELGDAFDSEEETRRRVANVPDAVADAVDRLRRYGMPFFQRVASERENAPDRGSSG